VRDKHEPHSYEQSYLRRSGVSGSGSCPTCSCLVITAAVPSCRMNSRVQSQSRLLQLPDPCLLSMLCCKWTLLPLGATLHILYCCNIHSRTMLQCRYCSATAVLGSGCTSPSGCVTIQQSLLCPLRSSNYACSPAFDASQTSLSYHIVSLRIVALTFTCPR
jgi:hypothetical protein